MHKFSMPKSSSVTITDSDLTFEKVYNKEYFPNEHSDEIKQANALVIPLESFRDHNRPVFLEGTQEFYDYIQEKSLKTDLDLQVCMSDEDFNELELHDAIVSIPLLLVTEFILPIVVEMITIYLSSKSFERNTNVNTIVNITVEKDGESKTINFEGKAEDFDPIMKSASKRIFKE